MIHSVHAKTGSLIICHANTFLRYSSLLPVRASEQSGWCPCIYIYMSSKKIVIERTRDLIYLKFVVTDFSPKIISHSAGENSGDSA